MSKISLGNGIEINYDYKKIDDHAETLVFMNGALNTLKDWEYFGKTLTDNYPCNVLAYDMRNQGESTKVTGAFKYKDLTEDTELLFEKLDLHNITLIAFSSGSTMAVDYAVNNPGKVKRLILGAPTINPFGNFKNQLISRISNKLLAVGDVEDMVAFSLGFMVSNAFCEQNKENFGALTEMYRGIFNKELLLPFLSAWDADNMTLDKLQAAAKSVETHFIYGAEDIFNPAVFVEELKQTIKAFHYHRIENVGHGILMENLGVGEYLKIVSSILK